MCLSWCSILSLGNGFFQSHQLTIDYHDIVWFSACTKTTVCILHKLNVVHKVYVLMHGLSLCVSKYVAACFFDLVFLSFVFSTVSSLIPGCSTCDQYMCRQARVCTCVCMLGKMYYVLTSQSVCTCVCDCMSVYDCVYNVFDGMCDCVCVCVCVFVVTPKSYYNT